MSLVLILLQVCERLSIWGLAIGKMLQTLMPPERNFDDLGGAYPRNLGMVEKYEASRGSTQFCGRFCCLLSCCVLATLGPKVPPTEATKDQQWQYGGAERRAAHVAPRRWIVILDLEVSAVSRKRNRYEVTTSWFLLTASEKA